MQEHSFKIAPQIVQYILFNLCLCVVFVNSIISTEVGATCGPMLECEPPSAHVIVPSLLVALAFYLFAHGVASSSFQVLNVAGLHTPCELMSGAKHSDPFVFCSQLMSFASQPLSQRRMWTPLKLTSPTYQPSTNAMGRTLQLLASSAKSPNHLSFLAPHEYHRCHPSRLPQLTSPTQTPNTKHKGARTSHPLLLASLAQSFDPYLLKRSLTSPAWTHGRLQRLQTSLLKGINSVTCGSF